MDKKEYFKCESCMGFHPVEDCEVAIIRIIKGKKCELKNPVAYAPTASYPPLVETPRNPSIITNEPPAPSKLQKPIIPPGILGMMLEPGHPQFESHGAKETRKT